MDDLKDRLRAEWQAFPAFGSGSVAVNHDGTLISSKSCITDSGMRLVNPDGPEAAARIEALEAALRGLMDSTRGPKVAGRDGGTYVVYPPSAEAWNRAVAVLAAAEREA